MDRVELYNKYILTSEGKLYDKNTGKEITNRHITNKDNARITVDGKRKMINLRMLTQKYFVEDKLNLKPIPGYEGYYSASYEGHIYSHMNGKFLAEHCNNKGYPSVCLAKDGKTKTLQVHRLVAFAWIEQDDRENMEVNHIDENKHNNNVNNLEWCSPEYNLSYNDNSRIYKGWETRRAKQKEE